MHNYKIGDHYDSVATVSPAVEATIKAIVESTEGVRLQVSLGEETALIYPWQIVRPDA